VPRPPPRPIARPIRPTQQSTIAITAIIAFHFAAQRAQLGAQALTVLVPADSSMRSSSSQLFLDVLHSHVRSANMHIHCKLLFQLKPFCTIAIASSRIEFKI